VEEHRDSMTKKEKKVLEKVLEEPGA